MSHLKNIGIFLLILLATLSCRSVKAPLRTVPRRPHLQEESFGGYIKVNNSSSENSSEVVGELITIQSDTIYILQYNGEMKTMDKNNVTSAIMIIFNTDTKTFAVWTTLGSISTISHGYGFLSSLLLWLVTGISVTSGEYHRINYLEYPETSFKHFRKFSRFPQGLPIGIQLNQLKVRPLKK